MNNKKNGEVSRVGLTREVELQLQQLVSELSTLGQLVWVDLIR